MDILMINDKPSGGKWTYDDENRKKYPAKKMHHLILNFQKLIIQVFMMIQ